MDQNPFFPMFVFPSEYSQYGLPDSADQPDIDNLVQFASIAIDQHCGRTDGDNNGSLAYTTYVERLQAQSLSRNIYYIPHRPLVAPSLADIQQLQACALTGSMGITGNCFDTGCLPSNNLLADGTQSAIVSASGRLGYGRRHSQRNDPWALGATISPIGAISLVGGPSQWQPLDMQNLSYFAKTGEIWFSDTYLIGTDYNEVVITYTSGYNPLNMPRTIKMACAAVTKNLMAKGSGTTGLTSFSSSRSGIAGQFDPNVIDKNIQNMLRNFVTVRT